MKKHSTDKWAVIGLVALIVFAVLFAAFMSWYVIPMMIIGVAAHFGADVGYWPALLGSLALSFLIGKARR